MKITAVKSAIIPSLVISLEFIFMVPANMAAIPSIPAMFHILAPKTTPQPTPGLPVNMAVIADPNSKRE